MTDVHSAISATAPTLPDNAAQATPKGLGRFAWLMILLVMGLEIYHSFQALSMGISYVWVYLYPALGLLLALAAACMAAKPKLAVVAIGLATLGQAYVVYRSYTSLVVLTHGIWKGLAYSRFELQSLFDLFLSALSLAALICLALRLLNGKSAFSASFYVSGVAVWAGLAFCAWLVTELNFPAVSFHYTVFLPLLLPLSLLIFNALLVPVGYKPRGEKAALLTAEALPLTSAASQKAALFLSFTAGFLGLDRFYLGYAGSGVLKLLTLGGLGIWSALDIIGLAAGKLRPADGHPFVEKELTDRYILQKAADGQGLRYGASKHKNTALVLSCLLGSLGADRFYLGYTGAGVLKLLTLGGLGVWSALDILSIFTEHLTPADGTVYTETELVLSDVKGRLSALRAGKSLQDPSQCKKKVTALVLSWLLGPLGANRFYLGYGGAGAMKLALLFLPFVVIFIATASRSAPSPLLVLLPLAALGLWNLLDTLRIATGSLAPKNGLGYAEEEREILEMVHAMEEEVLL